MAGTSGAPPTSDGHALIAAGPRSSLTPHPCSILASSRLAAPGAVAADPSDDPGAVTSGAGAARARGASGVNPESTGAPGLHDGDGPTRLDGVGANPGGPGGATPAGSARTWAAARAAG